MSESTFEESVRLQMQGMAGTIAAYAKNKPWGDLGDEIKRRLGETVTDCSVDLSSLGPEYEYPAATVVVYCDMRAEAEIRKIVHAAADASGLELGTPERRDGTKEGGPIIVTYGSLRLQLHPDGASCKVVKVGTRPVETPVYEVQCGDAAPAPEASLSEIPF